LKLVSPQEYVRVDTLADMARELGGRWNVVDLFEVDHFLASGPRDEDQLVLTTCSDAGINLQQEEHPNEDLLKLVHSVDWKLVSRARDNYLRIPVGPAIREGRCDPRHLYSCKTDRWTWCTFPEVPEWVRLWYTVNLNVEHPRLYWAPFGLNNDGPGSSYVQEEATLTKDELLYVNFQNNSLSRAILKHAYARQGWATVRMSPDVPVRDYLREMAAHKFVLCPAGNGLDCYRTYEALYCGSIPVLEKSRFAEYLRKAGLPVLLVDDLLEVSPDFLVQEHKRFLRCDYWDYSLVTRSYWYNLMEVLA
jgi:hypothetical protein